MSSKMHVGVVWAAGLACGLLGVISATGCERKAAAPAPAVTPAHAGGSTGEKAPVFSLAWSEYPSWSVFGVASERGLIDGAAGKMGPLEKKHNVDIELRQADYDPCLQMYATGSVDAVCITNMDVLSPAISRTSVMVLPTSTSNGGDALIAAGATDLKALRKPAKVFGLTKSVSEYAFVRGLIKKGEDPSLYEMSSMDPGAAAQAMQVGDKNITAIMVWNPFVLQTLRTRSDAKVLLDSTLIPGEIIDSVVIARDSLGKPGGEAFARCIAEAFYGVCGMLADPKSADATYVALGEKFSSLNAADMRIVCSQTEFYNTAARAREVLGGAALKGVMETVVAFCVEREMVARKPVIAFGATKDHSDADLVFDPSYLPAATGGGGS